MARYTSKSTSDDLQLQALLQLYDTLRSESLNTINNRIALFVAGIAAIIASGTAAAALAEPIGPLTVRLAFSGSIPVFASIVLLIWLSEAIRSHRVGYYLASDLEPRINQLLKRRMVDWETALWTGTLPRDEILGPSMVIIGIFGLIAVSAPVAGIFVTKSSIQCQIAWLAAPYGYLAFVTGYVGGFWPRLRNNPTLPSIYSTTYLKVSYSFKRCFWGFVGSALAGAALIYSLLWLEKTIGAAPPCDRAAPTCITK